MQNNVTAVCLYVRAAHANCFTKKQYVKSKLNMSYFKNTLFEHGVDEAKGTVMFFAENPLQCCIIQLSECDYSVSRANFH